MNDLFKGLLAGAAAWKLGGGLISTILIFIRGVLAFGQMLNFNFCFRLKR